MLRPPGSWTLLINTSLNDFLIRPESDGATVDERFVAGIPVDDS